MELVARLDSISYFGNFLAMSGFFLFQAFGKGERDTNTTFVKL